MKANEVFSKAAIKLSMEYLGNSRDGRFLFGYFKDGSNNVYRSFFLGSIKAVVNGVQNDIAANNTFK